MMDVDTQKLKAERAALCSIFASLSKAGTPGQMLDLAMSYLASQFELRAGLLYLFPFESEGVVASHGLGEQVQGRLASFLGWWTSRIGPLSDGPIVVAHPNIMPAASLLGKQGEATTLAIAGISVSGRLMGLAAIERLEDSGRTFTSEELDLLTAVLRHLALALENLRLRAFDISAFRELSEFPVGARTIEEICERILDRIRMLFPSLASCVVTMDKVTEQLELRASHGLQEEDANDLGWIASLPAEKGAATRTAVQILSPEETVQRFHSLHEDSGATCAVACMRAQESYVGAIVLVLASGQELTDQRQLLLASLASQAGLVIRSADLLISSQEMVVQEERSRIAREIHDGVAQNLALLMIKMEIISRLATKEPSRVNKELETVMGVLESSVHELRRSIYALRSPDLARLGLLPALKRLTRDFTEQTNIDVSITLPLTISVSPQCESAVFSVVQERLDAVARDGSASEVSLCLVSDADGLTVRVQDNGRQMRPSRDTSPVPSWQTRLTDRIRPFGGSIQVSTTLADTKVEISIPVSPAQP